MDGWMDERKWATTWCAVRGRKRNKLKRERETKRERRQEEREAKREGVAFPEPRPLFQIPIMPITCHDLTSQTDGGERKEREKKERGHRQRVTIRTRSEWARAKHPRLPLLQKKAGGQLMMCDHSFYRLASFLPA